MSNSIAPNVLQICDGRDLKIVRLEPKLNRITKDKKILLMLNRNSNDGTKADSGIMSRIYSSASIAANRMLVAVLSAIVSAYEWVREDSFVGMFIDKWLDFIISALKLKSSFNIVGLFTLYPLFITVAFTISFSLLIIFSTIATVFGIIGGSFYLIILLIGFLFMKKDVSKNSH
jgi:hypothetical protein